MKIGEISHNIMDPQTIILKKKKSRTPSPVFSTRVHPIFKMSFQNEIKANKCKSRGTRSNNNPLHDIYSLNRICWFLLDSFFHLRRNKTNCVCKINIRYTQASAKKVINNQLWVFCLILFLSGLHCFICKKDCCIKIERQKPQLPNPFTSNNIATDNKMTHVKTWVWLQNIQLHIAFFATNNSFCHYFSWLIFSVKKMFINRVVKK